MKTVWSYRIDNILKVGYSLDEAGLRNWALQKDDALNALIKLEELQVPILGGDVCEFINGILQYNYDNWYCDRLTNESHLDFVSRSIKKAKEYIEHYNIKESDKIFFALVPECNG